jgi:site-specific DNA recombinase
LRKELEAIEKRGRKDAERQRRRIGRLQDQRLKLLQAHYADAVPLDLLKREQARISQELQQAEQALATSQTTSVDLQATLDEALALAGNCQRAYRVADPRVRRQFNQAFFEKLYINEDGVGSADLAEPFAELLAHDLTRRVAQESAGHSYARSSNVIDLVPLRHRDANDPCYSKGLVSP